MGGPPYDPIVGYERISATKASRAFSEVLDQVEKGRSFVVERHGRDVCRITKPPSDRRRASECLEILRSRMPVVLDERFGADLLESLQGEAVEERGPWDS
jgi:antitoxin (DNA-binding transcriptional repressor) of toxin-antitoxin stability system